MGKEQFKNDLVDLLCGETLVFDNDGNRIRLSEIPGGIYSVNKIDYPYEVLKKAFNESVVPGNKED